MAKDSAGFSKSFLISVAMHVVFFTALLSTMNFGIPEKKVTVNLQKNPNIVKATVIDKRAVDAAIARQAAIVADELHRQKLEQDQILAEQRKAQEAIEQAQQLKIQKELEVKRVAQEKLKLEQDKKLAQQQLQIKKEAEKQAAVTATKQQAAAKQAAAKQAEAKRLQQAAVAKQAADKLVADKAAEAKAAGIKAQQDKLAAEHQKFLLTEVEIYRAAIQECIEGNRIVSSLFASDISCKIQIKLLPDGSILSVKIVKPSGNPAYDEMSTTAVYKSAPFPMPQDKELYNQLRDIVLSFENGDQVSDVF